MSNVLSIAGHKREQSNKQRQRRRRVNTKINRLIAHLEAIRPIGRSWDDLLAEGGIENQMDNLAIHLGIWLWKMKRD
jgi:hypothetical protein